MKKDDLKSKFTTGSIPSQSDYEALINTIPEQKDKLKYLSMSVTVQNDNTAFNASIDRARKNAMDFTLVDMIDIQSATDSNPVPLDNAVIEMAIKRCQENTSRLVLLKPHLGVNWSDGFYRGKYIPDNPSTFFTAWKSILMNHAQLCDTYKIPVLCLACEQPNQTAEIYKSEWVDIITDIKNKFPKLLLTTAQNQPGRQDQRWLNEYLDIIGINWYPPYSYDVYTSPDEIQADLQKAQRMLMARFGSTDLTAPTDLEIFRDLAKTFKKPIWFTETGVMPKLAGLSRLYDARIRWGADCYQATAVAMEVFLTTMSKLDEIIGVSWWHAQDPFSFYLSPTRYNESWVTDKDKQWPSPAEEVWNNLVKEVYARD